MVGEIDGWMDERMDGWMDGWMDGRMDGADDGSLPCIQALFWQQEPRHGFPFVLPLFILPPASLGGMGSVQQEQGPVPLALSHTHTCRHTCRDTHTKGRGHWVTGCMFLIKSLCVCVCVCDCTAILCTFCGLWSELGRTPWSDGMFKVQ